MHKLVACIASLIVFASCSPKAQAGTTPSQAATGKSMAGVQNQAEPSPYAELSDLGFTVFPKPQNIPSFEFAAPDGKKTGPSDFKGKFVLLNFWATWCPPCRSEMPSLSDLHKKYGETDLAVFAVSVKENVTTVKKFLSDKKYAFPIVVDAEGSISDLFVGSGIPTTYILDRDGKAIAGMVGGREWNTKQVYSIFDSIISKTK